MHCYIIMGVAGSGKSTVAKAAAEQVCLPFIEADDHHGAANKAKMKEGIALDDRDREPWINRLIGAAKAQDSDVVMSCSALTKLVRKRLRAGLNGNCTFIHLHGSPRLIRDRLMNRKDHFFQSDLLASQFTALEMPNRGHTLNIENDIDVLVAQACEIIKPAA